MNRLRNWLFYRFVQPNSDKALQRAYQNHHENGKSLYAAGIDQGRHLERRAQQELRVDATIIAEFNQTARTELINIGLERGKREGYEQGKQDAMHSIRWMIKEALEDNE